MHQAVVFPWVTWRFSSGQKEEKIDWEVEHLAASLESKEPLLKARDMGQEKSVCLSCMGP